MNKTKQTLTSLLLATSLAGTQVQANDNSGLFSNQGFKECIQNGIAYEDSRNHQIELHPKFKKTEKKFNDHKLIIDNLHTEYNIAQETKQSLTTLINSKTELGQDTTELNKNYFTNSQELSRLDNLIKKEDKAHVKIKLAFDLNKTMYKMADDTRINSIHTMNNSCGGRKPLEGQVQRECDNDNNETQICIFYSSKENQFD